MGPCPAPATRPRRPRCSSERPRTPRPHDDLCARTREHRFTPVEGVVTLWSASKRDDCPQQGQGARPQL